MKNYKILQWFLPVFSGIFLILSYPPFSLIILPFFSFLPLLFFLSFKNISLKKSFFAGFVAGFIFFTQTASWLLEVLPVSITDIRIEILNSFLIFLVWLVSCAFMAVFFGFFSVGFFLLRRNNFWDVLLAPSLWVVLDYLRVLAFGVLIAGSESLLGHHWTFGNLAYSLAQNQWFRSLAGVGGIYLVSFLVILINFLFFYFLKDLLARKKKTEAWSSLVISLVLLLIVASYFSSLPITENKEGQLLRVAVLQTKVPSSFFPSEKIIREKAQIQKKLLENVSFSSYGADVIVFPEGSGFLEQGIYEVNIDNLFEEKDVLIIDSAGEEDRKFIGTFFSTKDGVLGKYEKMLLVPYSNYLPYTFELVARVINKNWLEYTKKIQDRKKGEGLVVFDVPRKGEVSLLFCSESVSPNLHRELTRKGTQIFFNAGSLAFSNGSKSLNSQTLAMLQLRAAENGRYLVRATNYGSSYIINDKGDIVKITPDFENQVIFGEVYLISETTLYTKYGDWILIFALLIVVVFYLTTNFRDIKMI